MTQIPAPPPSTRGAAWLPWVAAAVLLVVATGLAIGAVTTRPGPPVTPTPVATTPTPTVTPSPTSTTPSAGATPSSRPSRTLASASATVDATPRAWQLPPREWEPLPAADGRDEVWQALQVTELEGLTPPTLTGCPAPATVTTEEAWRGAVRAQWHCVHEAWVPVFTRLGWPTAEPPVAFFPGKGSKSGCGYLQAPAFYCSADGGAVYFGGDHLEMARAWDLSVNEMVNHEYGHHLQNLAGITAAKSEVARTDDIERRAELQATCWAGTMTWNNRSFEFGQAHFDGWEQRLATMLVDGVHGSRQSIEYWGSRGLYAQTMGDCNTWVVESGRVT